jgi:hypothetical protein
MYTLDQMEDQIEKKVGPDEGPDAKNLDQIDYCTEIFMSYVMTSPGRSLRT